MTALPMRKPPVPSSTLLKFLRAQNEGYPFFAPNHAACHSRTCAPRPASSRLVDLSSAHLHHRPTSSNRSMATFAPIAVSIESSLFPFLESLWKPRTIESQQQPHPPPQHAPAYNGSAYPSRYAVVPAESPSNHLSSRNPRQTYPPPAAARKVSASTRSLHDQSYRQHATAWRRFWGLGRKKSRPTQPLQPNDLPQLPGFLDDSTTLGRVPRPANEMRLRCTEFDENGNVTLVNGEFKKSELIAKYGLLPRDLRKIDSSLLPSILVRPSAILINLLHLRVLIKHNRVLVFDAYGSTDTYTQSLFMYDLEGKLRNPEGAATRTATPSIGALPYEFRALESVLISVTSGLEGEFETVRDPVVRVLRELEEDIDRDKLRHLLIYSKKLGTFEQKARLVRDAIDDLLEADDDLAAMYLSERWGSPAGRRRGDDDHTEVEMLLESYHKVCDEIVQVSGNLVSNIRNTEEIVKAILDANRNSLMLLDLKFSIGTLGLGGGTFVAALYGMNLKNFIEESDLGFWGVSAWCTVFSIFVCYYGLRKLRRVQRVSMWGSSGDEPGASSAQGLLGRFGAHRGTIRGRAGWAQLDAGGAAGGVGGSARGSSNSGDEDDGIPAARPSSGWAGLEERPTATSAAASATASAAAVRDGAKKARAQHGGNEHWRALQAVRRVSARSEPRDA